MANTQASDDLENLVAAAVAAACARRDELISAMRPFVEMVASALYNEDGDDDEPQWGQVTPTVAECRAARACLMD